MQFDRCFRSFFSHFATTKFYQVKFTDPPSAGTRANEITKTFDCLAFNCNLSHSNLCSMHGAMNFKSGYFSQGAHSITINTGRGVHASIWGLKFTVSQYLGSVNYNMDKNSIFRVHKSEKGRIMDFIAALQNIRLNIWGPQNIRLNI